MRSFWLIGLLALISLVSLSVAPAAQAEPVTLSHAYGTITLETPPKRVVSVGYHEQDFLYALGIAPVGVHEWFGGRPYATWSWAEPARAALGAEPEVQRGFEIDFEWVWQQKPDLIIATFAPLDAESYATLSKIAPVLGPPEGYANWTAPWQEEMRLIAAATGRVARGEEVIAHVEGVLNDLATTYSELTGPEATVAYVSGTELVGYGAGDGANRMLADLGLTIPPEFDDMVTEAGSFSVSLERLDIFDRDVTVWLTEDDGRQMIEALPLYQKSRLRQEKRSVWADEEEMGALSFQSPLSIPWVSARIAPRLSRAITGSSQD